MNMEKQFTGKVIWFNPKNGYGFIEWSDDGVKQKDMFVHFSDIVCEGFKTLTKDQQVTFKLGKNHSGNPKAVEVTVAK
jgi:CspA family cold shock protein